MIPKKVEVCTITVVHKKLVANARKKMPDENMVRGIGDFFRVLGEPTRIKIVNALSESEMCVCDLAATLQMNQPAISHHLSILKQADLVRYRKAGKVVYYSLSDVHVKKIYEQGMLYTSERKGMKP